MVEPYLISETIGWFEKSFEDTSNGEWIPQNQLIYPLFSLGGFLSILGLLISVFPVFLIILNTKTLEHLKGKALSKDLISQKEYAILGGVYGLIGLATFPILVFAQSHGTISYFKDVRIANTNWDDLRVPAQNTKLNPVNSEPAFESWIGGLFAYHFDAGNDDDWSVHFVAQMPHKYKEGTDFKHLICSLVTLSKIPDAFVGGILIID